MHSGTHSCKNFVGQHPKPFNNFGEIGCALVVLNTYYFPFISAYKKPTILFFRGLYLRGIFIVGLFNLASVTIANPSFFFTDIFSFSHGRPHTLYSSKSSSVTFYITNNFIDILAAFWCTSIPNICLSKANSVLPCSWNNKCSLIFRQ